ncbi:hypothetical protein EVG20_g5916 [Dentipellis fragilis]|uniref:Longin domain-containing protein n=1 Tax=Dentipellis fragilis TaxID=205917 RepID=A0A4Y9YTZ2_9AGAM|nr:hypothetical protein EVG20_g5916 [Dentipellis fragilis]
MAPSPQCTALAAAISRKGVSYGQLAGQLGTTEQHVIDIVTGKTTATTAEFNSLARALGITDVPPHDGAHSTKPLTSKPPSHPTMSLIHALVAQGATILAEHQAGQRDFSQATQTILSRIPPNNSKLTYVWEQYLFHYISEGGFTYLVMADDSAGRRMPFTFLGELQRKACVPPILLPAPGSAPDLSSPSSASYRSS